MAARFIRGSATWLNGRCHAWPEPPSPSNLTTTRIGKKALVERLMDEADWESISEAPFERLERYCESVSLSAVAALPERQRLKIKSLLPEVERRGQRRAVPRDTCTHLRVQGATRRRPPLCGRKLTSSTQAPIQRWHGRHGYVSRAKGSVPRSLRPEHWRKSAKEATSVHDAWVVICPAIRFPTSPTARQRARG